MAVVLVLVVLSRFGRGGMLESLPRLGGPVSHVGLNEPKEDAALFVSFVELREKRLLRSGGEPVVAENLEIRWGWRMVGRLDERTVERLEIAVDTRTSILANRRSGMGLFCEAVQEAVQCLVEDGDHDDEELLAFWSRRLLTSFAATILIGITALSVALGCPGELCEGVERMREFLEWTVLGPTISASIAPGECAY